MKHLLPATLLIFSMVCCLACQKEPPPGPEIIDYNVLPPITQEGKNTFGCKVDGEVWVPRVELFVPWFDKVCVLFESGLGSGNIISRVITLNQDDEMQLYFGPTFLQTGKYYLPEKNDSTNTTSVRFRILSTVYRLPDMSDPTKNWVEVTFIDTVKNIVSGRFQFDLKSEDNQKISVTEGRFDMKYNAY
jgi:hypothetical protein